MEGTWTKVISYNTFSVLLDRVAEPPGLCLLIRCAGVFLARGVATLLPGFRQLCGAPQGLLEEWYSREQRLFNSHDDPITITSSERPALSSEFTPL